MPDWYPTLAVARELNRPPWQFDGFDPDTTDLAVLEFWKQKVLIAKTAENMVQNTMNSQSDFFKKKGKGMNPAQNPQYQKQIEEQMRQEFS